MDEKRACWAVHSKTLARRRIAEPRTEKEAAEEQLRALGVDQEADPDELSEALSKLPDLSEALRHAPTARKRQVFEAFCLEIRYDKVGRRVEISATVSEAVAQAF